MAIDLYSKASVDSLLSAKLSISSLSNAATSTLNATAPTTGQALTFDGTDLVWATVGGGGGGASWGSITGTLSSQTDLQSELDLKANLSAPSFTGGIVVDGGINCSGPSSPLSLSYSGITFADSTTQTTAAVSGANKADIIALAVVQDATWSGSGWIITFAPINQHIGNTSSLSITNGSTTESALGSWSSTSTWSYTTSGFGSTDALYISAFGYTSTALINFP